MLWRDPDTGRQSSLTYDDENDAVVAKRLLEATGGHADEAAQIAESVRQRGPTVVEVVSEHIDLLTAVGPDTRTSYRQQLVHHIAPTLGSYPAAVINYRAGYRHDDRRFRSSGNRRAVPECEPPRVGSPS